MMRVESFSFKMDINQALITCGKNEKWNGSYYPPDQVRFGSFVQFKTTHFTDVLDWNPSYPINTASQTRRLDMAQPNDTVILTPGGLFWTPIAATALWCVVFVILSMVKFEKVEF